MIEIVFIQFSLLYLYMYTWNARYRIIAVACLAFSYWYNLSVTVEIISGVQREELAQYKNRNTSFILIMN